MNRTLEAPRATATDAVTVFDARVVTGSGGGPDKTILNSPRFLTGRGYRMLCGYLYPPNDPGYAVLERRAELLGAPLVSIPDRGPTDWRVVRDLVRVCKRERVDIWHGHDYKTNALGLLLKRFHRMRLVTTLHGWVHHTARTPLYYRVDKFCLPRYERVYCVSDDLHAAALAAGVRAENCMLLENGIDTRDYRRKQSVTEAKAKLGLPPTGFLVGGVGRLEPEKAFDVLVRSVRELLSLGVDAKLLVVGEGSDRPRLEALATELGLADRVHLPGWQADARGSFEAMDAFALSSLREGLPNVVLEAMALEVPVAATRVNGVPKLIDDGTTGLLVPPNDVAGMTAALKKLADAPALRAGFAAAARRTVETRFDFAARMDKLAADYDVLLAR